MERRPVTVPRIPIVFQIPANFEFQVGEENSFFRRHDRPFRLANVQSRWNSRTRSASLEISQSRPSRSVDPESSVALRSEIRCLSSMARGGSHGVLRFSLRHGRSRHLLDHGEIGGESLSTVSSAHSSLQSVESARARARRRSSLNANDVPFFSLSLIFCASVDL